VPRVALKRARGSKLLGPVIKSSLPERKFRIGTELFSLSNAGSQTPPAAAYWLGSHRKKASECSLIA
jgi:hypothetical protein